jgi:hypothetical protein
VEGVSLLKNPLHVPSGPIQGLKEPAIVVFWP